jgi:hypothetical protein
MGEWRSLPKVLGQPKLNSGKALSFLKGNYKLSFGAAVGLVDSLTCPIVWVPSYSEDWAFYERL